MSNILTNLLKETSLSRFLHIVSTDFLALRLFCFNIRQQAAKSYILNYTWTAANFIIEGRVRPYGQRLCTVVVDQAPQTRDPRAACGPRRPFVRPETLFGNFQIIKVSLPSGSKKDAAK